MSLVILREKNVVCIEWMSDMFWYFNVVIKIVITVEVSMSLLILFCYTIIFIFLSVLLICWFLKVFYSSSVLFLDSLFYEEMFYCTSRINYKWMCK